MEIFDSTKSLVENLSYLSGPIIALLGFGAIIQIRIAKKAIVVNSKRQAAELATKQIDKYSEQIIPIQNVLDNLEKNLKFERTKYSELKDFTCDEIEQKISKEEFTKNLEHGYVNLEAINPVLNAMDTFSTYFVKGVADEEIAFSSVGSTYCYSIEKYHFDICMARSEEDTMIYHNLVELYNIWNPRLKSEKLSKELERKKQEIRNLKLSKIDILGTK